MAAEFIGAEDRFAVRDPSFTTRVQLFRVSFFFFFFPPVSSSLFVPPIFAIYADGNFKSLSRVSRWLFYDNFINEIFTGLWRKWIDQ